VERPRGNVAVGTKVHLVVTVIGVGKSLCPKRLGGLNRPLVVVEHDEDGVKVDQRRGVGLCGTHDQDCPLVKVSVAELRARKVGYVGDDHCRCLVWGSQRVVETLEACAEVFVAVDERDRHAKGRLLEEGRWRRCNHEVHVVLGTVEEDLPHPLGTLLGQLLFPQPVVRNRRQREHHVVDRRCAQVLGRARALLVLSAGDPRH